MSKVIRLTESDFYRLVSKVITEQQQEELAQKIVNSPKLKSLTDEALSNLSTRELISIKNNLNSVGIDGDTSLSDAVNAGNLALQQSKEQTELSEDEGEENINFVDRVKMGLGAIGLANTALFGSLGTSLIEKITNYANIDTSSSVETAVSLTIGIILMMVGNTVYNKLKRIHKD